MDKKPYYFNVYAKDLKSFINNIEYNGATEADLGAALLAAMKYFNEPEKIKEIIQTLDGKGKAKDFFLTLKIGVDDSIENYKKKVEGGRTGGLTTQERNRAKQGTSR